MPPATVRPGRHSQPAGQEVASGQELAKSATPRFTETVDQLLNQNRVTDAVREAVHQFGTIGTAHFNLIEMALSSYKVYAYNGQTHELDDAAQATVNSILSMLDNVNDYSFGFDDKAGLDRVLEQALNDVVTSSGCAAELVLDDARMPERLVLFPYDTITWKQGSKSRFPVQRGTGEERELNYATVFVADFHKAVNDVYSRPIFEAALRDTRTYESFLEDMKRALKRVGHGRLVVTLDWEKISNAAPTSVTGSTDPNAMNRWMEEVRSGVSDILEDMAPEDAFVTYDSASAEMLKSEGEKADYVSLMNALSGNLATALKSNPSILGLRLEGSQSLSNTESLLFLKVAASVRRPVEEVMSKALTLAARLLGADVYVEFKFDPINLRPHDELSAFRTMDMDRDLSLLSLGFITDLEFSVRQGLGALPPGYTPKTGTMFHKASAIDVSKASPNDGAQERALQPDTPSKAGGSSQ